MPGNQGSDWAIRARTYRQTQRKDTEEGQTGGNVDADQPFKLLLWVPEKKQTTQGWIPRTSEEDCEELYVPPTAHQPNPG
eukprot:9611530-Ditylum_brightwellii.AAC.1